LIFLVLIKGIYLTSLWTVFLESLANVAKGVAIKCTLVVRADKVFVVAH
jgi:hypothetical protein